MKRIIVSFLWIIFTCINTFTQNDRNIIPVIIDTDCAPDDLRAISMFAAVEEIKILAITSSDGALSPAEGEKKINRLIHVLNKTEIQIGAGKKLNRTDPEWREFCRQIDWGEKNTVSTSSGFNADELIIKSVTDSEKPVILVCLGPLSNIYSVLKKSPEILNKIKKVLWYNDETEKHLGENYLRDVVAADYLLTSDVNIDIITNLGKREMYFSDSLLSVFEKIPTKYASVISKSHSSPLVLDKIKSAHLQLWDDLIPVYLLYPELFEVKPTRKKPNISINVGYESCAVLEKIIDILELDYSLEKHINFDKFPSDIGFYRMDVRKNMEEIINKYGKEEWRVIVLTNEIHGHLGIYSIVGAKMGLKVREIFNVGLDKLKVISHAGFIPPLSCLNDGIQISTGATLGHGTIKVSSDSLGIPQAVFIYKNRQLRLSLKEKYIKQVENDISNGILLYGNLTSGYWKLVRKTGLKYWNEWDRDEIFDIKYLN